MENNNSSIVISDETKEVIEILKSLPENRKAYLSGYAAGMVAERHLTTDRPA